MSSSAALLGADSNVGIDDAVKQLRAALENDPSGYASNEVTRTILEQLNKEVAKLYAEGNNDDDEEEDDDEEYDDDEDYDDEEEDEEDEEDDMSENGGPRVRMPKGPTPYDLWKSSHQIDRPNKGKVVLTGNEWSEMVRRLNESSKRKQMFLLQAQHKQIKDELEGLTFMPQISEKSRELASNLKSLPDRVAALMRKRRAKLDAIRHEKAQEELKEATFKPKLNTTKPKFAATVGGRHNNDDDNLSASARQQRIGHLMQYEMDKRVRQTQRRQMIEEMEDRELTFTPAINKNSIRIVERLAKEREQLSTVQQEQPEVPVLSRATTGTPISPASSKAATKRALVAAMAATAASSGALALPHGIGRSYLPGHEEETFHPKINSRSATLNRSTEDKDVYSRLYGQKTASVAAQSKRPGSAVNSSRNQQQYDNGSVGAHATLGSLAENHTGGAIPASSLRDSNGFPIDENGEPVPGHPLHFNVVPYETGKLDFLLKRMIVAQ